MRQCTLRPRVPSALVLAILLTAVSGAQAAPAAAASGRWTRIGPDGGVVMALAAAPARPDTVYAGLNRGGVFRSTDAGATWAFAGAGLGHAFQVFALAVDAARPATVYAATGFGLYETTDGGSSWAKVSAGGDSTSIWTVAADPRRSGIAYAVLDSGLFVTADAGHTWTRLSNAPPDITNILVIDPVHPLTLYAADRAGGVFKSTDAGAHWKLINRGIPTFQAQAALLAVDPRDPRTVFYVPSTGPLYRSDDSGGHWTKSDAGIGKGRSVYALAIDPAASSVVFAAVATLNGETGQDGVFRSIDGGHTWRPAGAGLLNRQAGALLATRRGLFAATAAGVWMSHDRARTWQAGRGLAATSIASLAIDSQDPPRIYALDELGLLFRTASRGAHWQQLPRPASSDDFPAVGPMVIDPRDPSRLTLGFLTYVGRSEDGGGHWDGFFNLGCIEPGRILVDPSDSDVVYATGGFIFAGCALEPEACNSFKDDHGQVSCVRDPVIGPRGVNVIAIDPAAPRHLFATSDPAGQSSGALYQSFDADASWSLLSSAVHPFKLVFDPVHPGTLYAASYPGEVARSTDNGATWQTATTGLPADSMIISLVIDPAHPSTLYVATEHTVYRSTDSAATWTPLGTGLDEVSVTRLALDPVDPSILYADTYGGGVMELQLGAE
jgi:photosystem II stability/assembly factor-like uncharacterized protein